MARAPVPIAPAGENVENLIDERDLNEQEVENLGIIDQWRDLWNGHDTDYFVDTCYHLDVKATTYDGTDFNARTITLDGRAAIKAAEAAVKGAAHNRIMTIERYILAGNVVVVEAVITKDDDPEFRLAWCGILTIKDGQIISDHSYANVKQWPGLEGSI